MSVADAITFIDASIKRIASIPNKTSKAKLIDAYTVRKLTALKNSIINLASGFNLTGTEQIQLQRLGNSLVIVYLPVPEPALLFGGAVAILGAFAMGRKYFARNASNPLAA